MKYELKRIAVWPAIKISFMVNLVLGFIIGVFYAFFIALLMAIPTAMDNPELAPLSAISGAIMVFLPFLMSFFVAIIHTIGVVILVLVYNFFARIAGGLEFDVNKLAELAPVLPQPAVAAAAPISAPQPPPPPKPETPPSPHSPFSPPNNEPPQDSSL